jgi:dolichyl-phosphate-mannose-protein mannosyltransferase
MSSKSQWRAFLLLLVAIFLFGFVTRFWGMAKPTTYIFDEVYHAATAKLIAHNNPDAFNPWAKPPEPNTAVDWLHPPLAKYTQALGMIVFGENSVGWRISSGIFGTLIPMLVAVLVWRTTRSKLATLFGATLAALDGLLLVMSRIAMNDIHVTVFILLCAVVYISSKNRYKLALAGIVAGLAIGTKWSGVFVLVWLWLWEGIMLIPMLRAQWKILVAASSTRAQYVLAFLRLGVRWLVVRVALLAVVPILLYLAVYWQLFAVGWSWDHFLDMHRQTLHYQFTLDATHPAQSRPWEWVANQAPVWMAIDFPVADKRSDIYASGNTVLFWIGAAIAFWWVVVGFYSLFALTRYSIAPTFGGRAPTVGLLPIIQLLSLYFLIWVPWLASPRIMFFYHYTPAVPLLCAILALTYNITIMNAVSERTRNAIKIATGVFLALCAIFFALWYPHWTFQPVSIEFKNAVYFSWGLL